MSLSVGIDIEEIQRFHRLIKNKRFLNRIYSPAEIAYCSSKKNKVQHFAVRFAAKEAVWKAVSQTLSKKKKPLAHRDLSLENSQSGKPFVDIKGSYASLSSRISVSLSHSRTHAVAVAVYQSK